MTLWTCIVAASGDRKTSGLNVSVRALDLVERLNSTAIREKRLFHQMGVLKAKELAKTWRASINANPARDPAPFLIDAIDLGNFIEPRLYVTDPTIERLAALLVARPRGMMLIRDELAGFFANMTRYRPGSDRPFWLEAWDGGRHVVEPVRRSTVVEHLLVGVIGSFLARAFCGDEDGMASRFLYAWPATPEYRPLTNEVAEVEPELLNALLNLNNLPAEFVDGKFAPQDVWLSDGAIAKFEEFRQLTDKTKRALDGHEHQWFAKGETMVLRLAGTLAFLAWAVALGTPPSNGVDGITGSLEPESIKEEVMTAAIRLWHEFFFGHTRARPCDKSGLVIATEMLVGSCDGSKRRVRTRSHAKKSAGTLLGKNWTPNRRKSCSNAW